MLPGGESQVCRGVEPCGGGGNFFVCFPDILSLAFPLFSDPFEISTAAGNCPFLCVCFSSFVCVDAKVCSWGISWVFYCIYQRVLENAKGSSRRSCNAAVFICKEVIFLGDWGSGGTENRE